MDLITMDFLNLITFVVVTAVLVIFPGPNGLLIAKNVTQYGRRVDFSISQVLCPHYST